MSKQPMYPETALWLGCFTFLSIAAIATAAVQIVKMVYGH